VRQVGCPRGRARTLSRVCDPSWAEGRPGLSGGPPRAWGRMVQAQCPAGLMMGLPGELQTGLYYGAKEVVTRSQRATPG